MARVKISRKKLLQEPDEFLSVSQTAWIWVHENQKRAGIIVGAVVGAVLLGVLAKSLLQSSRDKRSAALATAVEHYLAPRTGAGGVPADVARELETFARDNGSSREGVLARYFHAGALAGQGDATKAAEAFAQVARESTGELSALSKVALAYLDLSRGDADKALSGFEGLLAVSDAAVPRAQIQMEIGAIHEKQGRLAEARRAYQAVADAHAEGTFGEQAKARLKALGEHEKSAS